MSSSSGNRSRRGPRHSGGHGQGGHGDGGSSERWLVSYADLVTLLFAFFVVMFAISQADLQKFRAVSESMKRALKAEGAGEAQKPINFESPWPQAPKAGTPSQEIALEGVSGAGDDPELIEIRRQLEDAVKADEALQQVSEITITGSGDQARLEWVIQDSYPEKSVAVPRDYWPLITRVVRVLSRFPGRRVRLEGHADPAEGAVDSREAWDLGHARAWGIAEIMMQKGLDPTRIEVTSHGSGVVLKREDTRWARARNRRVELRLSAQPSKSRG